jgi:hypothetical protein
MPIDYAKFMKFATIHLKVYNLSIGLQLNQRPNRFKSSF